MAGSSRREAGKIVAVIHLARKHTDALRLDLLGKGFCLEVRTPGWNDLYAFFAAAPPYSALHHDINEKWNLTDHLLATLLDRVNVLLWTKTKDAHKKPPRNMPKRIPRPGVDDRKKLNDQVTVMDISEFMRRQNESGRTALMAAGGGGK